jgi:hypothetical protein
MRLRPNSAFIDGRLQLAARRMRRGKTRTIGTSPKRKDGVVCLGVCRGAAWREKVGLRIYSRPWWANDVGCPGPNESRAPAPHSLVGSVRQAFAFFRFCGRRSDLFTVSQQSRSEDLLSLVRGQVPYAGRAAAKPSARKRSPLLSNAQATRASFAASATTALP